MRLNELSPAKGSHKPRRRVGRGSGSGHGKTCGRGHKGQKSRTGGTVPMGFEGGQMPLQRRIPKLGFTSRIGRVTAEVRLSELAAHEGEQVSLRSLIAAGLVRRNMKRARIILSGEVNRPYVVVGLGVTKGARAAIEAAGGKVLETAEEKQDASESVAAPAETAPAGATESGSAPPPESAADSESSSDSETSEAQGSGSETDSGAGDDAGPQNS